MSNPAEPRTFTVAEINRLEVVGAMLFLAMLPRTKRPCAGAARLKHLAEDSVPTCHGYISEANLLEGARLLGIPVKDGHVAVRLPRRPRNTHRRHLRR